MNFNNISTEGYKRNSPDRNNSFNFIPSNKITMQGVDKPLTLIPVVNGKPMFDKKVIANPGDDDFDFGQVDGVLEIPMAQSQYGILGGIPFQYERTKKPWEMYNTGMDSGGNLQANQISPTLNASPLQMDNGFTLDPMKQGFNPNAPKVKMDDLNYVSETAQERENRLIAEANKNQSEEGKKTESQNTNSVFFNIFYSNFQSTVRLNSSPGKSVIRPKSSPSAGGTCASKVIPQYGPKFEVYLPV